MDTALKVIIVSTSHWDRAWYVPFQEFRWALVDLLDQVLDLLDRDPRYRAFMLDGQSVTLEDYLEVRPEREVDIRRHVEEGRLQVGPWYVLPDEYLVSPEALVRNLLIGTRLADRMGGAMRHGYNPDSFGHISQLPQILQGFGIETALFWRGFGDEGEEIPNEFWWQAPDGSRVLASFLRFGYGNAAQLGYPVRWGEVRPLRFDLELALKQATQAIEALRSRASSGVVLLLNGTDHTRAQPELPEVIDRLREKGYDVHHGTITDYVSAVLERRPELPTLTGEFNRGRYSPILQGVYSTRMPLKQRNWAIQQTLERSAEPAAAFAWLHGAAYPAGALDVAWQWLLKNHPHDDICGSSVDQVHREMGFRFGQAEQIAHIVWRESLRSIAERVALGQPGPALMLWNPSLHARAEVAVVSVPFAPGTAPKSFVLVDAEGRRYPVQVLGTREAYWAEPRRARPRAYVDVAFRASVPAGGYATYHLEQAAEPSLVEPAREGVRVSGDRQMENEKLRVTVEENGCLMVEDKATGKRYGPLHFFEDTEDSGDEYDYSPAPRSTTIWSIGTAASWRWVEVGPLRATLELRWELRLPAALAPDRRSRSGEWVSCPVTTRVSLLSEERRLEFVTEVDNRAKDHRLRVWFDTGISTEEVLVDGHFDLLRRPVRVMPRPDWHQPPVPTGLARRFVAVHQQGSGFAVLTRGLPEYEAIPGKAGVSLAVTLLRCVGWLSREDLLTRPGHAGPAIEVPEAQLLGSHRFEYAVQLFDEPSELFTAAEVYHNPLVAVRADTRVGLLPEELREFADAGALAQAPARDLPARWSWIQVEPPGIGVSAIKRSEDGRDLVIQLFNLFDEERRVELRVGFPVKEAWRARLDETPVARLDTGTDQLSLAIRAKEVVTLRLTPA